MSDVFISYARVDSERADQVAAALQSSGLSVWIDRRGIETGRAYDQQIEEALTNAPCVIVLWTAASVKSDWVRNEAAEAYRLEKLIPVLLDGTMPPLQFKSVHAIDLRLWDGSKDAVEVGEMRSAVERRLHPEMASATVPHEASAAPTRDRLRELFGIGFSDPRLEKQFGGYFNDRTLSPVRMFIMIAACLYGFYAVIDFIQGEGSTVSKLFHLIVTPVLVGGFLLSLWTPMLKIWRPMLFAAAVAGTILVFVGLRRAELDSTDPAVGFLIFGFMVGTLVFDGLLPMRFLDQLVLCAAYFLVVAFRAELFGFPILGDSRSELEIAGSVFVLVLVNSWWRERLLRRAFLESKGLPTS